LQDAGSSGSSNGSSSSSSSSDSSNSDAGGEGPLAGDSDPAAAAAARRHRDRLPAAAPAETDSAREAEDIRVAGFYQNDGDYRGAYLRAKDAVSLADDDAEAHLALAEAARKLGKLDEADSNYKKCLTLDPVPKVKKAAEKALKEMQGGN
jgi:Flp pilus assembly protein TadD